MTFFDIALKNARMRCKNYLACFFSTAFCVFIFFLFSAMYFNPSFEAYRFGMGKMSALFRGAAGALALLAMGYGIAALMNLNGSGMALLFPAFVVIVVVAAGTFLLFRNFVPWALARGKNNRGFYYQTPNFIGVSLLAFRVRDNARMLTLAALLCAITVTMLSASVSLYKGLEDATDFYAPYSYLAKNITPDQRDEALRAVAQSGAVRVTAQDRIELIKIAVQNDEYALEPEEGEAADMGAWAQAYLLPESVYKSVIDHTKTPLGAYRNTRTNFALYGAYVFIGLFIGALFLLAVGSVLYYKLVIEAQEDAPRYGILRKIGMKGREARSAVAKELGFVYAMPLMAGLMHTVFALLTYNRMLDLIGQETPTLGNALLVVALYVAVYGAFYALCVKSCFGIVWKQTLRHAR